MAFRIETIEDLIRLLEERPEWRERLREVLLTPEERAIPAQLAQLIEAVRELSQSHRAALQRLERLEQSHQAAIERLERLEQSHQALLQSHYDLRQSHEAAIQRLERLEQSHQALLQSHYDLRQSHEAAIQRLERLEQSHYDLRQSHEEAIRRLERLEETVARLAVTVEQGFQRFETEIAKLKGYTMEIRYQTRGPALFGRYVSRPRVVDLAQFIADLREQGCELSEAEWDELSAIDLLLSAKHPETKAPLYLAVEISWMLFVDDVERARERAAILRRCGVEAYPALAGEGITPEAQEMVSRFGILTLLGGRGLVRTLGT